MGNFYANYTIKGASPQAVIDAFSARTGFVAPEDNGCIVVYDEQTDMMNAPHEAIAAKISGTLGCVVLGVGNHDDDVLFYQLFENGEKTDEYNSYPDYFDAGDEDSGGPSGGLAEILCRAFGSSETARIADILGFTGSGSGDDRYLFAVDRHPDLVKALGACEYAVGFGYRYVSGGEYPPTLGAGDFVATG